MIGARVIRGLVVLGIGGPILAGLAVTLAAAFGWLPAIGARDPGLDPWRQAMALPGVATSLRLTLVTGFGATAASLALGLALGLWAARHPGVLRWLSPLLAVPHAALAIGLAFLIAPSGWIARGLSGPLGWTQPPDLATVGDPWGLALILGLMLKEVPFLLLLILAALSRVPVAAQMAAGRALGYGAGAVWAKVIVPQLYPLIRLPVFVVLAFSLSVVDMALILGPSHPPTLAVAILRGFSAPDPAMILPASALAMLQAGIVAGGIGLWWLAERALAVAGRHWLRRGRRRGAGPVSAMAAVGGAVGLVLAVGSLAVLVIWSLAWRWRFPQALPESWSLRIWAAPGQGWGGDALVTLGLGLVVAALALALAIAWLEAEDRLGRRTPLAALVALPLLVPQIAFLQGVNVVFLRAGLPPGFAAVVWAHLLFVFPYVLLALAGPWRALDAGLIRSAASLGAGPVRRLAGVKLPILLRPILTAAAIGFAVSVAQYLPTLFLGGGRVVTLTTEAVALSSASDRRVAAVYAVLQGALPLLAFGAAIILPALLQRNRAGLTGGLIR